MNILHILSEREFPGPDFVFQSLESLNEDFGFIPAEQTCLAQHFHVCHRTGHIVNCQSQVQFPVLSHRETVNQGIIVRNRNNVALCEGCLRITVGDAQENNALLSALRKAPF